MVKYLLFLLILISNISFGCVAGSQEIPKSDAGGFKVEVEQNQICETCNSVGLVAPSEFKGQPYRYALFSVYLKNKLVSKTLLASDSRSQMQEFYSLVSNEEGISFELVVEYGSSRCTQYKYTFNSK